MTTTDAGGSYMAVLRTEIREPLACVLVRAFRDDQLIAENQAGMVQLRLPPQIDTVRVDLVVAGES